MAMLLVLPHRHTLTLLLLLLLLLLFLPHTTLSVSVSVSDLDSERAALLALRSTVGGRTLFWNATNTSPCDWAGVQCHHDHVVELHLPAVALSGQLPLGIFGNLTHLRTLSLRFNALTGTLPSDLASCLDLRNLYLQGNLFSGQIPPFLFRLPELVRLNMASNNFSGDFPAAFDTLVKLKTLFLDNNQLSGPIPELNHLDLDQFNVSNNLLNGSVPLKLQRFTSDSFLGNSLCGKPLSLCPGTDNAATGGNKLSGGAIAGIVIGSVVGLLLLAFLLMFLCRNKSSNKTSTVDVATVKHPESEVPAEKSLHDVENGIGNGNGNGNGNGYSAAAATINKVEANGVGAKKLVFFGNSARGFDLEDLLRASAEVLGKGTFGNLSLCLLAAMASNTMDASLTTGSHSRHRPGFAHCDSDEENGDYNQQQWQHNDQAFSLAGSVTSKDSEGQKAFYSDAEKRKDRQEKRSLMSNDQGEDDFLLAESRQPLWRKVAVSSGLVNPYRIVIVMRFVVLVFFFHYRISTPVHDALALWIITVVCEIWLALSWLVDQLPKWFPITRVTYLERLSLRFEREGEPNLLPSVDVFVTTADPSKEPPIVTANTVLSVLSVDYPVDKVCCYVSDDSASMLLFDTLSATAEFARIWVPFCNKYKIEPRAPEFYFSQKVDYLKDKVHPTFVKDRRAMKREYEEFKVKINVLVAKAQKKPEEGWVMQDGNPWPGNNTDNHPAMVQVSLGSAGALDSEGRELPRFVYVAREKRPRYQDHRKAGAMNSLVRVSAVLSNAPFVLNLDCDQYINNSKALREAMCFLMDPQLGKKLSFVQFPRRFDAIDSNDRYANRNTVFFDITMKCLDGVQGPMYVGSGCVFNRQALYGYKPPSEKTPKESYGGSHSTFDIEEIDEGPEGFDEKEQSSFLSLKVVKKRFGMSPVFIASALMEDGGLPKGTNTRLLIKEAIHVISCGYEEKTEWGKEIGWLYGSVTEDILTGFNMHCRGWKSVYCMPKRAAFKGSAPINLSDRLHQVLKWALGSTEIFFSGYCPLWYGYSGKLKLLQRLAYTNAIVYPFTSIPLLIYCTIPAICLLTGKTIIPAMTNLASIWLMALFISMILTCMLELRWSGVSIQDWWRNEQFWIIGGVSAHLFAVFQGLLKVGGVDNKVIVRTKSTDDTVLGQLHLFKWTTLLIPPTSLVILNMVGIVAGLSSAINKGYASWGPLFGKLFFSFWVIVHLYPFLKGLMGRQNRTPTIVVLWSTLLALVFSMIWVRIDFFLPKQTGPVLKQCGIEC